MSGSRPTDLCDFDIANANAPIFARLEIQNENSIVVTVSAYISDLLSSWRNRQRRYCGKITVSLDGRLWCLR